MFISQSANSGSVDGHVLMGELLLSKEPSRVCVPVTQWYTYTSGNFCTCYIYVYTHAAAKVMSTKSALTLPSPCVAYALGVCRGNWDTAELQTGCKALPDYSTVQLSHQHIHPLDPHLLPPAPD